MDYQATIEYLFRKLPAFQHQGRGAYKANLNNAHQLDRYYNYPHSNYPVIHVAGTNGKGSVSHMLASVFIAAGYKTGLYTSPHLKDYSERIRVNGHPINKQYVTEFVSEAQSIIQEVEPSFFELSTFMAFSFFAYHDVDVAIIETGLGGRLDTTNVVHPVVSIITNIGLDHVEILGHTHREIAREKAGIIKPGVPVIIGETQTESLPVFQQKAFDNGAFLSQADACYSLDAITAHSLKAQTISIKTPDRTVAYTLDLPGSVQYKNLMTVLKAIDCLPDDYPITEEAITKGLANVTSNTGLRGRMEVLNHKPLVIADVAHNSEGIQQVMSHIYGLSYHRLHIIIGFVKEKEMEEVFRKLPEEACYYFTKASVYRAMEPEKIAESADAYGLHGKVYATPQAAYKDALQYARKDDLVFIGGSTFIVAELLP